MVQSIIQLPSPTPGQALPITDQAWHSLKMLFLAAYAFLLRLPSEALSMTRGGIGLVFMYNSSLTIPCRICMPGVPEEGNR